MEFVLVPVPQDLVMATMQYIVRIVGQGAGAPWDAEAVAEVWHDCDAQSRLLLSHLAAAAASAVNGAGTGELEAGDAADRLGASVREVAAIVNELNSIARETHRPNLITARVAFVPSPVGGFEETRMLRTAPDIAGLVNDIAHA